MRCAWLVLLVCACTVEERALETREAPLTTCAQAFAAPPGAACALDGVCSQPTPAEPVCCREIALCPEGKLIRESSCDPGCRMCADDPDCQFGLEVCELHQCQPCPPADCAPCPDGWEPRDRNGCPTCDCVPTSQCRTRDGCGDPLLTCYQGFYCEPSCPPGDVPCCANVCALQEPRCPEPAPLGCAMRCPPDLGCAQCVSMACECLEGMWHCQPMCAAVQTECTFFQ